jgi:hypothetical protein
MALLTFNKCGLQKVEVTLQILMSGLFFDKPLVPDDA